MAKVIKRGKGTSQVVTVYHLCKMLGKTPEEVLKIDAWWADMLILCEAEYRKMEARKLREATERARL